MLSTRDRRKRRRRDGKRMRPGPRWRLLRRGRESWRPRNRGRWRRKDREKPWLNWRGGGRHSRGKVSDDTCVCVEVDIAEGR